MCKLFCRKTGKKIINIKHILKYLKGTINKGIEFTTKADEDSIEAFTDWDFAGDPQTRHSTSGYVIYYGDGPVAWCSKKV